MDGDDNQDLIFIVNNYQTFNLLSGSLTTILRSNDAVEEDNSKSLSIFETRITVRGDRSIRKFEKKFGAYIDKNGLIIKDQNTTGLLTMSSDGKLNTRYQIQESSDKIPLRKYHCLTSNISFDKLKKEIIG